MTFSSSVGEVPLYAIVVHRAGDAHARIEVSNVRLKRAKDLLGDYHQDRNILAAVIVSADAVMADYLKSQSEAAAPRT